VLNNQKGNQEIIFEIIYNPKTFKCKIIQILNWVQLNSKMTVK